jgi:hypothetical protein
MKLHSSVLAVALLAAMPLGASAQVNAQAGGAPPPELRAKIDQARGEAKTAAFNGLSPDHRAKVQAIVDQINAGKLTDLRAAVQQIDGILTPDEAKAVLGERDKMMAAIHGAMPQNQGAPGAGPGPGGPGAATGGEHQGPPGGMMRNRNDAGRVLLQLSVSRETMRALRQKQEQSQPQTQPQNPG